MPRKDEVNSKSTAPHASYAARPAATCLTWITRPGFGRDAMDRVANHRASGVTDVYDRHGYAEENRRIMSAVTRHVLSLVEGAGASNVISLR